MKKRITAIFLAVCMIIGIMPVMANEDVTENNYNEEIGVVKGLGIMSDIADGDFEPNNIVTRADIADTLSNFLAYGQTISGSDGWSFFGDASEDEGLKDIPKPVDYLFSDVNATHWAYEQIENVVLHGLMNGTETDMFGPDENASFEQIVKTVVTLLGYEAKAEQLYGGYPTGYIRVATELGLIKGLSLSGDDNVTRAQLAYILYRALYTDVSRAKGFLADDDASYLHYYTTKGETLLTETLGVYEIQGVVTDNGITSLEGKSKVGKDKLIIGGQTLEYTDSTRYVSDYTGRHIKAYYFKPGTEKEYELIYAYTSGRDSVVTIDASRNPVLTGNKLCYEDEDGDEEELFLTDYKYVIYNGEALTSYTPSVVSIDMGTVTVIQGVYDYDILIIQSFESWFVNSVDTLDGIIYNKITGESFDPLLYKNLTVVDTAGNETDISKIVKDDVIDIARNGETAYIVISHNIKTGIIEGVESDGSNIYVYIGGEAYTLADSYYNYLYRIDFSADDEVSLYLNSENKIIYAVEGSVSDLSVGYLIRAAQNENRLEKYPEALISESSLQTTIYKFAKRITVSDETGEEYVVKNEELISRLGSYSGIVRYAKNDDNEIYYLEMAINDPDTKISGKMHIIYDSAAGFDESGQSVDASKTYYKNNMFAGRAIISNNTKTIAVNPDKKNDKEGYLHSSTNSLISNNENHNMAVYTTVAGSYSAEYAVITTNSASAGEVDYYHNRKLAIVQKISKAVNHLGEPATKLYVFDFTLSTPAETAYYATEECKLNTAMGNPLDPSIEDGDLSALGVGDLISWAADKDGNLKEVRLIWDEDGENEASPLAIGGTPGGFPGSYGYFDISRKAEVAKVKKPVSIPNPWGSVSNDPQIDYENSVDFSGGQGRFFYGFPVDMKDGVVRITTYDVVKNGFNAATLDMELFKTEVWGPTNGVVSVNIKNNKANCKYGSILNESLRTYSEYKENCSRIINVTSFANNFRFIIINGYSD